VADQPVSSPSLHGHTLQSAPSGPFGMCCGEDEGGEIPTLRLKRVEPFSPRHFSSANVYDEVTNSLPGTTCVARPNGSRCRGGQGHTLQSVPMANLGMCCGKD